MVIGGIYNWKIGSIIAAYIDHIILAAEMWGGSTRAYFMAQMHGTMTCKSKFFPWMQACTSASHGRGGSTGPPSARV